MPITIGQSIAGLSALRRLDGATTSLASSYERLSSGQRINHASDDAAGLAVADSLRKDTRLYTTAIRNISDGISALNIVDGTLSAQTEIISRLTELAEQAANGTFSEKQRLALNTEYQSLVAEFGRIGDTTKFNNVNLLRGGYASNPSQISIQSGITGQGNSVLGVNLVDVGSFSGIINIDDLLLGGSSVSLGSLDTILHSYNDQLLLVKAKDSNGVMHDLYLGLQKFDSGTYQVSGFVRANESNGALSSDPNLLVDIGSGGGSLDINTGRGNTDLQFTASSLAGGATLQIQIDMRGLFFSTTSPINGPNISEATALSLTGVETQNRGRKSLEILGRKLNELSTYKGQFGAFQKRLEVEQNISSLSKIAVMSAESRIRDVDIASETANLISAQIKQQSAAGILAHVGSDTQIVLSLLRS